ncbi:MAG: TVP38/TMEM64 family protein [Pseudomonadota bacterium]
MSDASTPLNADPMMSDDTAAKAKPAWVKWAAIALGAVALFAAYRVLPIADWVSGFQTWVQGYGALGWFIFIGVYAVTAFALVPGSFLTLAAGAVWGLGGFPLVILGATLGSAMSFLAARYAFHDRVQSKVAEYPKFRAVNEAIRDEGWKVVGLLRLSPALPFSLQNWFLGITPVNFWPAQIATFFGIMPGTLLYVLLGSAGGSAAAGGDDASLAKYVVLGVGIIATLVVTVIVTKKAKAKMAEFEGK